MMSRIMKVSLSVFTVAAIVGSQAAQAGCHSRSREYKKTSVVTRSVRTEKIHQVKVSHIRVVRTQVPSGATITLRANFLGNAPGFVLVKFDNVTLTCKVVEWQPNRVTIELPQIGIFDSKAAELNILLPDGRLAQRFWVDLVAPSPILVHEKTIESAVQFSTAPALPGSASVATGLELVN